MATFRTTIAAVLATALVLAEAPAAFAGIASETPASETPAADAVMPASDVQAPRATDAPAAAAVPTIPADAHRARELAPSRASGLVDDTSMEGSTALNPVPGMHCPAGRVRLSTTAGIWVFGMPHCTADGFVVSIDAIKGTVGGMPLTPRLARGLVTVDKDRVSGRVVSPLPLQPRVVPSWDQTATLTLSLTGPRWRGTVDVEQSQGDNRLSLTGDVDPDSGFSLAARGIVSFAGTHVSLSGTYLSPAGGAAPTWRITGHGAPGGMRGASLRDVRLAMTQEKPGVTGTASLHLDQAGLTTPVDLAVPGSGTWFARVAGPTVGTWNPARLPFVTVQSRSMSGSIGMVKGRPAWALVMPMTLVNDQLTALGTLAFTGPQQTSVRAIRATGSILGTSRHLSFSSLADDSIVVDGSKVSGRVTLRGQGDLLFGLPAGWISSSDYTLRPVARRGAVDLLRSVDYSMANGRSSIHLTGPVPRETGFSLRASGAIEIADDSVPVSGYFASAGAPFMGHTTTRPEWSIQAAIDQANGGEVVLPSGAALTSGTLQLTETRRTNTLDAAAIVASAVSPREGTPYEVIVTGDTTLTLAVGDDFYLHCTYVYEDENNWEVTAAGDMTDTWQPFDGFSIPDVGFHGTVKSVDGQEIWNVTTDEITWKGMVSGADMTTSFTLGNTCPLEDHCPSDTSENSVFVGGQTVAINMPEGLPDVTATGAFLADASWLRWDGISDPVTFSTITIDQPTLTVFMGARDDADPNLGMPDLSGEGADNGLNVQFCGDFRVEVPDIDTYATSGCAGWTDHGVVIGQVQFGGDFDTSEFNGIALDGSLLNGFGWTDLPSEPTLSLNGVSIPLIKDRNHITASLLVPGNIMHDFGTGSTSQTAFTASGWFSTAGDFEVDASIPVGLSTTGVTLNSIDIHVGKDGNAFDLLFTANSEIKTGGHHYPAEAYIGFAKDTDTSVTVGLSVRGQSNASPQGSFDVSSLLQGGDFEPVNASLIDGSFDTGQAPNSLQDGGFEDATQQGNLMPDPGFDDSIPGNLLHADAATMDTGKTGNFMPNADFEDSEFLTNGDFEGLDGPGSVAENTRLMGWMPTTNFSMELKSGTAPTTDVGEYVIKVTNKATGTESGTKGVYQTVASSIDWVTVTNARHRLSAWARTESGTATVTLWWRCQDNGNSYEKSWNATTSWQQFSMDVTNLPSCQRARIGLGVPQKGASVQFDDVSFQLTSPGDLFVNVTGTPRPMLLEPFDKAGSSTAWTSWASDTALTTDRCYSSSCLRTDGNGSWWMYKGGSVGDVGADFDFSVKVMIPNDAGKRDIANIAFWQNGSNGTTQGYFFRVQNKNGDGGFFTNYYKDGKFKWGSRPSGTANAPDLKTDTWYDIRLIAVDGTKVTAIVTNLTDNTSWVNTMTVTDPTNYPAKGRFGQIPDAAGSTAGSRWDDIFLRGYQSQALTRWSKPGSHGGRSGNGYLFLYSPATPWSAEQVVPSEVEKGTYTYTTWIKGISNGSGKLVLETDGPNPVGSVVPITFTTGWTQVSVSLRIKSGSYSGLRVGFSDMTTNVSVDDQGLTMSAWIPSPDTGTMPALSSSSVNHSGVASMMFAATAAGQRAEHSVDIPVANTKYTVSAWVRADKTPAANTTLSWTEDGRATTTTFKADTEWRQVTLPVTSLGAAAAPMVAFTSGAADTIYIDDVEVTAIGVCSDASGNGTLGKPPVPTGWSVASLCNRGADAQSGSGVLQVPVNNGASRIVTMKVTPGYTYTLRGYARSGAKAGSAALEVATLVGGKQVDYAASPVVTTSSGAWTPVSVDIPITKSGAESVKVTLVNRSKSETAWFDDVTFERQGLAPMDDWIPLATGGTLMQSAQASGGHSGTNFFRLKWANAGGSDYSDDSIPVLKNQTVTTSAWVRNPTGTPVTFQLGVATVTSAGAVLQSAKSASTTLPAGSDWRRVFVSLTATQDAEWARTEIIMPNKDEQLDVDDVHTTTLKVSTSSAQVSSVQDANAPSTPNYLAVAPSPNAPTVAIDTATDVHGKPISVNPGTVFEVSAYVRAPGTAARTGTITASFGGVAATPSTSFTATSDWQQVTFNVTASGSAKASSAKVAFALQEAGAFDIDSVTVTPEIIVQDKPFKATSSAATWAVHHDPTRAHDGSLGVLEMNVSGSSTAGVEKSTGVKPEAGGIYSATVFVRSPTGTSVPGRIDLSAVGGASASTPFTATGTWKVVNVRLPLTSAGGSDIKLAVLATSGGQLDVDDAVVVKNDWTVGGDGGSKAEQSVIDDGAMAREGNGYQQLINTGSGRAWITSTTQGPFASGSTISYSAYVRSTNRSAGVIELQKSSGQVIASTPFTAAADWTKVAISSKLSAQESSLKMVVRLDTPDSTVDIDSVVLTDQPAEVDGITTPLPHPERGYSYLWDDAFGIPGVHLWAITAQVSFVKGRPGLGVGATVYQDPTRSPGALVGTAWAKGDMALNVSRTEPCFSFSFDGGDTGTGISIAKGALKTTEYKINIAPVGCEIGPYVVPRGASLSFDSEFGDGTVHLDLAIGRNEEDQPSFTGVAAISNIIVGRTTFKDMSLTVDITPTSQRVQFLGDILLPTGTFYGVLDVGASTKGLNLNGAVSLKNWKVAGGGFNVHSFNFVMNMDVPFGVGQCGSFDSATSGKMDMAKKTKLDFVGQIVIDCGRMRILHFEYMYVHRNTTQKFMLDYNSARNTLAGGTYYKFERKTSWKFIGKRYRRTLRIQLGLAFSMELGNPSAATVTLGGELAVSNGSGSVGPCTINGDGADDECELRATIKVFGFTHRFSSWW